MPSEETKDPEPRGRPSPDASRKLAGWALAAAVAGFLCLPLLGGLVAIGVGLTARSELKEQGADAPGRSRALLAVLLGVLNVVVALAGLAILLARVARPAPESDGPPPLWPPPAWPSAPPHAAPVPAPSAAPSGSVALDADAGADAGPVSISIGALTLIDVSGSELGLRAELLRRRKDAEAAKERLLLWVVAPECAPCEGVRTALPDPVMQKALSGFRLIRVDVASRAMELARLGIPVDKIPGFALLGSDLRPSDYVHGGEWDADVAKNIAPVLGPFVRGKYAHRRHPWTRPLAEGETTL